eukprot:g10512.t1
MVVVQNADCSKLILTVVRRRRAHALTSPVPDASTSHCPGSSPIGVFGGFLSSSGSSPSIADVSSSPPTVIVVFISSHVPTFLSTCVVCSLGPRSRRITDNGPVWSSPPSLGITEAKSARIPAIVDACPP